MALNDNRNISELTKNPFDVDISIIVPTIRFDLFENMYNSLIVGCPYPDRCEMLIKVDDDSDISKYYSLLKNEKMKFKILMYPKCNSVLSLHVFLNDLSFLSSGKLIWILNDDCLVSSKDWYTPLVNTRNIFDDNIYCVMIHLDNGKGFDQIIATPAVSREWFKFFGYITKFPNYDRWICEMSRSLKRSVNIDGEKISIQTPQGKRVMSKQERKDVFYPKLQKELKRAKKKLK